MLLNKHAVFACNDLKTKDIDMTKEWGGTVRIRVLSAGEQLELDKYQKEDTEDFPFILIMKCCITEDNKPLFDNPDEDIKFLKQKSSEGIIKLYKEVITLNKQNPGDVEELAKNS